MRKCCRYRWSVVSAVHYGNLCDRFPGLQDIVSPLSEEDARGGSFVAAGRSVGNREELCRCWVTT